MADGATSSGVLHASTAFTNLELTVTQGDFKVGGVSYNDFGIPKDVSLNFGYSATDHDGDLVTGSFAVTVTLAVGAVTALSGTADHLLHPDSNVNP